MSDLTGASREEADSYLEEGETFKESVDLHLKSLQVKLQARLFDASLKCDDYQRAYDALMHIKDHGE